MYRVSHSEVKVAVNNSVIKMFDAPFRLQLMCTRVGGWELWALPERGISKEAGIVGGEYRDSPFALYTELDCFCASRWDKIDTEITTHTQSIRIGEATYPTRQLGQLMTVEAPAESYKHLVDYYSLTGTIFWSGRAWKCELVGSTESEITFRLITAYKQDVE